MIIAVTSLKGGVGKTTTSVLLAEAIAQSGHKVTLLDTDPERSALSWSLLAEKSEAALSFRVVAGEEEGVVKQAKALASGSHNLVIDSPPNDKSLVMSAAMAADVALIPLGPTRIDVERLGRTLSILGDLREVKPDLDIAFLLTMYSKTRVLSRAIVDQFSGHRLLDAKIRFLEAYRHAFGKRPTYLDEYQALWQELSTRVEA